MENIICLKCLYKWNSLVLKKKGELPKQCPLCKRYNTIQLLEDYRKEQEGEKECH